MNRVLPCIFLLMFSTAGCQTAQQKNLKLVKDRVDKLKPLSSWRPQWCRVETRLTQPAVSRYRSLYPKETEKLAQESWAYTWKARESTCEITALEDSPMVANHKAFLETALCTLLQTHWVNSPFDELMVSEKDIRASGEKVQIAVSDVQDLGLFLDREKFTVTTKTKSRGVIEAVYSQVGPDWLPQSVSQRTVNSQIMIDQIVYAENPNGARRLIQSFWLSIAGAGGDPTAPEAPIAYTQVSFSQCQGY